MRNLHKYEELFPDEFDAELKRSPIIYCAFGPMEYHCAHSALGIDPVKGYEMCLRAAVISGGIVFPMIPIAPSGAGRSFWLNQREEFYDSLSLLFNKKIERGSKNMTQHGLQNSRPEKKRIFFGGNNLSGLNLYKGIKI